MLDIWSNFFILTSTLVGLQLELTDSSLIFTVVSGGPNEKKMEGVVRKLNKLIFSI